MVSLGSGLVTSGSLASGFTQHLNPLSSVLGSTLVALVPIALLLVLLAVMRVTAWLAVIIGAVITIVMAMTIWHTSVGPTLGAWGIGAGSGIWAIDWITFWGVVLYNTLVETGAFAGFRRWLVGQATSDVRVQTILLAWSLGALLEGLVGFGYPWAVIAPILVGLGVVEIDALRVAAIANNAPVSFGALGAPILALATVTGAPLMDLSASVGRIVAVLALLPPWILILLVTGRRGIRGAWPLAVVGSLSYILGQFPTSQFLGPYLPDIIGSLVSFGALLLLLRYWRPKQTLGYGGVPLDPASEVAPQERPGLREAAPGLTAFGILIVVVVAATGPWSHLGDYNFVKPAVSAISSLSHKPVSVDFKFAPAVGGTWILVSWLVILVALRVSGGQVVTALRRSLSQMWGALLVAPIVFGLAQVFNYAGMASTLAYGFSRVGTWFVLLAPLLGWIGVALTGSNTSTNALFGGFQYSVGALLKMPLLLLPSLNSTGAEVGKPVAPQTTSVGVSTGSYVRREGDVIRHNMGWTLVILAWLILVGLFFWYVLPSAMRL